MTTTEEMAQWAQANPGKGRLWAGVTTIRDHFSCSYHAARKAKALAQTNAQMQDGAAADSDDVKMTYQEGEKDVYLTTVSSRIRTVEDALGYAEVDVETWQVDRFLINSWEMGFKGKDGLPGTQMLWQVKVWLKRRVLDAVRMAKIVAEMMDAHAPQYKPLAKVKKTEATGLMLEMDMMDLHLGKFAWHEETGENYDRKIAKERLFEATETLVERTSGMTFERILLPAGNDLLHVDNLEGETFSGTGQDADSRATLIFRDGLHALIQVIDRITSIAPVDVPIVPGNHDQESMFHLGEALVAWYRHNDRVTIDNGPTLRKYVRWGRVLLGFTHGGRNSPPVNDLPLIMAQERKAEWGETTWREWHLGHWHKRKETRYVAGETYNGVHVRVIPALCGVDAWHYERGYTKNWKSAEAYIWSKEQAYMGNISAGIDPWSEALRAS